MKKRLFAGLLTFVMMVNLMSAVAFAEESEANQVTTVECSMPEECLADAHVDECAITVAAKAAEEAAKKAEQEAKCAELCGEEALTHVEGCAFRIEQILPAEKTSTAEPVMALSLEDEPAVVEETTPVAKIGNEEYTSLEEAMKAAKSGETVELVASVDLAGTEWEPVSFKGAFDGKGYSIKNMTINKPGVSNTGFVTSLNGTIKNVIFENPTVTGGENTGVVAGRAGGGAALAENIKVTGTIKVETTHSGYARAGVIVGGWAYGNYKDIVVDGGDAEVSYIKHTGGGDGRYVAGIVGHADAVESYTNCTVKNITISGGWLCGGIAGPGPGKSTASECLVENVNMDADYSGGIFGWFYAGGPGLGIIKDSIVKNVTFSASAIRNGAIGGYGIDSDVIISNVTASNVKNYDGAELIDCVAAVGDVVYTSLADAVASAEAGSTVTLLKNVSGDGVVIDKDITIDFAEKTYTVSGKTVGSAGTENLGFQILKGNKVVLKNGSIGATSDKAKMLIQNYADLTVTDMNLTGKDGVTTYILSNNNGTVVIDGKTDITAPVGAVAFDVYDYQAGGYSGVNVTIDTTGTITGRVEVSGDGSAPNPELKVDNGTFKSDTDAFVVEKGTLTINNAIVNGGTKNDGSWCAVWANGGAVIINDGTFHTGKDENGKGNDTIYTKNGGTVTINGGKFSTEVVSASYAETQYACLNENDANRGTIKVYGGTFVNFDPANNVSEGKNTNFVVSGYETVKSGLNYVVGKHELKSVAGSSASCTGTGIKAHYKCDFCGKLYSDAAGITVITDVTASAKGHKYSTKSDSSGHWSECSRCGDVTDREGHSYTAGKCSCGYETKVEVYVPETTTSTTPAPAPTTPATQPTTTQPTTTTTPSTEETTTEQPVETPVEEIVVDTKIVEEVATEEVKAVVKETVTVAEVKEVEKTTETGTVTVTEVKVAVTTETVDKVIENTEEGATVILPLTEVAEEGQAVTEAEVAVDALEKIVEAEAALTVEFEGVKVTFETETIKAIAEQAQGSVIELRVVPVEHHELNEEQQAILEEHDVAVRVSAQIFCDGEYIGDFKGGKARIAIPFTPEEGKAIEHHKVYFVDDNGEMTLMPSTYVDGHMVLETTHFSDYVIVYEEVADAEEIETVVEDAEVETEEAVVEEADAEAGLPIVPIIIVIVVIIAIVAFFLTKKKNDEE